MQRNVTTTARALHTTDFPLPVLSYFTSDNMVSSMDSSFVALVHGLELLLRAARARVEHLVVARRAIGRVRRRALFALDAVLLLALMAASSRLTPLANAAFGANTAAAPAAPKVKLLSKWRRDL